MTGGSSGGDFLSSTELLTENGTSWLYLPQAYPNGGVYGNLPTPRSDFSGLNVDDRVIMFGKLYLFKYLFKYLYRRVGLSVFAQFSLLKL